MSSLDFIAFPLEGGHEQSERADVTPHKLSTTLFLIMTFLALVTVGFEKAKDYLMEEVATHDTKPVIVGLFSELTVLGFLSLVTFVVSQANVLDIISGAVFGEGEEREGYLEELLEKIHFLIFAIMVIFIAQSLVLLHITNKQLVTWKQMNAICSGENANKRKDIDEIIDWLSQEEYGASQSCCGWRGAVNWLLNRNTKHSEMLEVLRFDAMRSEFLTPRSQFPPFDGIVADKLPDNFDYAKYMQTQILTFLTEIIEVPQRAWAFIWGLSAGFCFLMIVHGDDPKDLAWGWAGFGWVMLFVHRHFQNHLNRTLSMCCNRKYMQREKLKPWFQRLPGTETEVLVRDDRPGWTSLELPDPARRSWFEKWLFAGHVPNRQHLLFPTQVHAQTTNEFFARLYLLCYTVYCSLLFFTFMPIMVGGDSVHLVSYLAASLFPLAYYVKTLPDFVRSVVEVNALRVFKPSTAISTVLRDQKAERAIKAILLLNTMREQFNSVSEDKASAGSPGSPGSAGSGVVLSEQQKLEIGITFDMFDVGNDGEIDPNEFRELMASLGVNLSLEQANDKLKILDEDGNGACSKDEFIKWHAGTIANAGNKKKHTVEELVDQLFELFDSNNDDENSGSQARVGSGGGGGDNAQSGKAKEGDGVITTLEFRDALNRFNANLNDEEVATLLQELDEDQNGTIDKKEFTEMLEKYAAMDI